MTFNFSHETQVRVRYGETDQMGYCYYGNYAQFFEIGRVETLRALGINYKSMEEEGILLPVSEFHIHYLSPAFYDDELTIKTIVSEINGARIRFDYEILNKQPKIIAKGTTTLVFVTKEKMKPLPAPQNFIRLLQPYVKDS